MMRGTWDAPVLPPNLQLVGSGLSQGPLVPMPASRSFSVPEAKTSTVILAVFDIEDSGANISVPVANRMSAYLAMSLAATGKFQVVPRDMIKQSLKEQKKESYRECYDQSCQIEVGKEVAAQKSLSTTIAKLGSKCTVTSVLYDLRRAASEGGASATGHCDEDGIVNMLESVVAQLAR